MGWTVELLLNTKGKLADALTKRGNTLRQKGEIDMAITVYAKALQLKPDHPEAHYNLGIALMQQGDSIAAADSYKKAIYCKPEHAEAHINLGNALLKENKVDAAITAYAKALQLKPDHPEAHYNLGIALMQQGDSIAAADSYKKAIYYKPEHLEAHINLGSVLFREKKIDAAITAYSNALQLKPDHAKTLYNLGLAYMAQGNPYAGKYSCEKALKINPKIPDYHYGVGRAKADIGDLNGSKISFQQAIQLLPQHPGALFELSKNIQSQEEAEKLANHIKKSTSKVFGEKNKSMHEFALANCYQKLRDHAKSSQHLDTANRLKLLYLPSDLNSLLINTKRTIAISEKIPLGKNQDGKGRIFIVGVPRCGSTLLESVLTTNPQIKGLGETQALQRSFSYFTNSDTSNGTKLSLADVYTTEAKEELSKYTHSVDKNLYNYAFVEAIARAMPSAKIIHCCRNPLDHVLSMLRSNLKSGHNYTADPLDAAKSLIFQEKIMRNFKAKYKDQIHTFDYDKFTSKPYETLTPLIRWLDLEWNASYLRPETNNRAINTASVVQARSPINSNSIGGWKNYKELLHSAEDAFNKSGLFDM